MLSKLKTPSFVLFHSILLIIAGCATNVTFTQYIAPLTGNLADVELVAVDKYRNSDNVRLSLVSRTSCAEKTVIAEVAKVGSKGLFGVDSIYRSRAKLPANERVNLNIFNVSDSGFVVTRCSVTQSFQFEAGRSYALRVNNWSTSGESRSTFGCNFQILEIGADGRDGRVISPQRPQLPHCPTD